MTLRDDLSHGYIEEKLNGFWNFECSRKRFSEKQAEHWWAENRARVYEQYNVHMIDKSSVGVGVGSEDLAH